MTVEITWLIALPVGVGGGFLLLRQGIKNVRRGLGLRHLPLLDGVDPSAMKSATASAWPVGPRWPSPYQHQAHLDDEDLRAAYARLARARARAKSLSSEVLLLSASALLSFSLPGDISNVLHVHVRPVSTEGYGAFLPRDAPLEYVQALWRSLLLFVVVAVALAIRADGQWMLELAHRYETHPHHEAPTAPTEASPGWLDRLLRWR